MIVNRIFFWFWAIGQLKQANWLGSGYVHFKHTHQMKQFKQELLHNKTKPTVAAVPCHGQQGN